VDRSSPCSSPTPQTLGHPIGLRSGVGKHHCATLLLLPRRRRSVPVEARRTTGSTSPPRQHSQHGRHWICSRHQRRSKPYTLDLHVLFPCNRSSLHMYITDFIILYPESPFMLLVVDPVRSINGIGRSTSRSGSGTSRANSARRKGKIYQIPNPSARTKDPNPKNRNRGGDFEASTPKAQDRETLTLKQRGKGDPTWGPSVPASPPAVSKAGGADRRAKTQPGAAPLRGGELRAPHTKRSTAARSAVSERAHRRASR